MSIVQKIIVFRLHDFLKTIIFSVGLSFNIAPKFFYSYDDIFEKMRNPKLK